MKKIIFNMLLLLSISVTVAAQAYDPVPMANTPATQPENNGYNNAYQNPYAAEMYRSYWVWDKASSTWVKRIEFVGPYTPVINTNPVYQPTPQPNSPANNNPAVIKTGTKPPGQ